MPHRISGVDFVTIPVQDLARARAFYSDFLGLPVTIEHGGYWCEMAAGDATVALFDPKGYGTEFSPSKSAPCALHFDDLEATLAKLDEKGIKYHYEKTPVCHMIFFGDTEGNGVMLHHRFAPET